MINEGQWILPSVVIIALIAVLAVWLLKRKIGQRRSGADFDPNLLSKFRSAIPNVDVRDRLMNAERKKSPQKSESELIADVLDAYYRDRR
jgi:hypothetical protein